jgi:diacylglycerol kinase family enzyme
VSARPYLRLATPGSDLLPFGHPLLIGDAAAGAAGMAELRRALAGAGVVADSALALRPGRARELAEAALAAGTRYLVAVGGDTLIHELINVLVRRDQPPAPDHNGSEPAAPPPGTPGGPPVLGLVPLGRQDFAATLGIPDDPVKAARHLLGGNLFRADVGRARWKGASGAPLAGLFANMAEVGFPAELSCRRQGLLARAGRVGQLAAAMAALRVTRSTPARLGVAHTTVNLRLAGLCVANGQFSMGRMPVAPRALPDDGRLSVIAFEGEPLQIYAALPRLRFGDHVPDRAVREFQSPTVQLDTAEPLTIALDGCRVPGRPPVTLDLLPGALYVKV